MSPQRIFTGLASAALLLSVGAFEGKYGTRQMSRLGELAGNDRWLACLLLCGAASVAGLPGLSSFGGLFATLGAVFKTSHSGAVAVLIAWAVLTWTVFWMLGTFFSGVPGSLAAGTGDRSGPIVIVTTATTAEAAASPPPAEHARVLSRRDLLVTLPLVAGILFVGFSPQAIVDLVRSSLRISLLSP
jgi:NADH:ubiquinone oxidoreductase subunit 4 (subunit M)